MLYFLCIISKEKESVFCRKMKSGMHVEDEWQIKMDRQAGKMKRKCLHKEFDHYCEAGKIQREFDGPN